MSYISLKRTFYLPSYPDKSICTDYLDKCSLFLNSSPKYSSLIPDCDKEASSGIQLFPNQVQTVLTIILNMTHLPDRTVNLETKPFLLESAIDTSGYSPICPDGFVVPDNSLDADNQWYIGSACAAACRYFYFMLFCFTLTYIFILIII